MSFEDVQNYMRAANSAREFYNSVTQKQEEPEKKEEAQKEDDKDDEGTFATAKKVGTAAKDVYDAASKVTFSFDRNSGVKLAGMIDNPLEASLKQLSPAMKEYAEMIKVSTELHKYGVDTAIKRLKTNHSDYELDVVNSTDHYAIIKKPNGKVIVAFRGTDPKNRIKSGLGKGAKEPWMWIAMQGGKEDIFEEHKMNKIKDKILKKYRPEQIEQITGYSMGASKAKILGDLLGIDTHLYNPFIGKKFYDTTTPNTKHQIVRTTEDLASTIRFLVKPQKMPDNVKVESIDPINTVKMAAKKIHSAAKTDLQSFNLLDNHNLEHFTGDGDRSYLLKELNDQIIKRNNQFHDDTRGLSKNSEEYNRLREQLITELEPTLKLASQETQIVSSRSKMFKTFKPSNIVTALAGIGGGAAVDNLINEIESATGIPIDDHITTALSGGLGALPQETVAKYFGGHVNFAKAVTGGIGGAVAQQLTAEASNAALQSFGMDVESAEIVSQTLGGGVGGMVTAGGGALVRHIALRIAARIAALGATEAITTTIGAEIGSIVPGFGTLVGAGIGALVSAGFAIFDLEMRIHAPVSDDENEFLQNSLEYMANGGDISTLLAGIDDGVEKDRLRNFINSSEYTAAIEVEKSSEYFRDRIGASLQDIRGLETYLDENVPDFFNQTGREKNRIIRDLASDPANHEYFRHFRTLPVFDENPSPYAYMQNNNFMAGALFGRMTADWNTPASAIIYRGRSEKSRIRYLNSDEYKSKQEHITWLNDKIMNDDIFNSAENLNAANARIFEMITDLAQEQTADGTIARDFGMNGYYHDLIPQFDSEGTMTTRDYQDGPYSSRSGGENFEPEPVSVATEDYQTIIEEPDGTRQTTGNMINNDQQIQDMLISGDIDGINRRIREIFEENKNTRAFEDVISYDDAELPQFTDDGRLVYQKISDPSPTDSIEQSTAAVETTDETIEVTPEVAPKSTATTSRRTYGTRQQELARKMADKGIVTTNVKRGPGEMMQQSTNNNNNNIEQQNSNNRIEQEGR
jgi:hypothetical protein